MRIYLGENIRPLFEEDSLVFEEHGIEFGDWTDTRKASIEVPISEVSFCMNEHGTKLCRMCNIMDLCMHISFSPSLVRNIFRRVQHTTPRIQFTKRNVYGLFKLYTNLSAESIHAKEEGGSPKKVDPCGRGYRRTSTPGSQRFHARNLRLGIKGPKRPTDCFILAL
jgi:hypothetical protein